MSDLFTSINTYEPEGTLEDRWGPKGYIVCELCELHWVCHWDAFFAYHPSHHKCGYRYVWVEYDKFRELNPDRFTE